MFAKKRGYFFINFIEMQAKAKKNKEFEVYFHQDITYIKMDRKVTPSLLSPELGLFNNFQSLPTELLLLSPRKKKKKLRPVCVQTELKF